MFKTVFTFLRPCRILIHLAVTYSAFFIFSPCFVEAYEGGLIQEGFKNNFSLLLIDKDCTIHDLWNHTIIDTRVLLQKIDDANECRPERSGGFVKLGKFNIFFDSIYRKAMLNQLSAEKSNNTASGEDNNIIENYWHPRALLLGFDIGGVLVIFVSYIVPLFFYTTV
jgi:hypothetical protein